MTRFVEETFGLSADLAGQCDGTWCTVAGGLNRLRMNILGVPDCGDVADGRVTCTFTLSVNQDMGPAFDSMQMPFGGDPVTGVMARLFDETTNARDADWPEVSAILERGARHWRLIEAARIDGGHASP